jgi:hypothetical protein
MIIKYSKIVKKSIQKINSKFFIRYINKIENYFFIIKIIKINLSFSFSYLRNRK